MYLIRNLFAIGSFREIADLSEQEELIKLFYVDQRQMLEIAEYGFVDCSWSCKLV
jgi:hypothetical protein